MKKIILSILGILTFFIVAIVAFVVYFIYSVDEDISVAVIEPVVELVDGDEVRTITSNTVTLTDLSEMVQARDSLRVELDSIYALLVQRTTEADSLNDLLAFRDATVNGLESQVQQKDVEITNLREVDVNAKEMARTFGTMSVVELAPIVAGLSDKVVLDIYKNTSSKKRKNLLAAMGTDRAAQLTNRLVTQKGS